MRLIQFTLLLMIVFSMCGCSGAPSWLKGTWRLDSERTKNEFNDQLNQPLRQSNTEAQWHEAVERAVSIGEMSSLNLNHRFTVTITDFDLAESDNHYWRGTMKFKVRRASKDECLLMFENGDEMTFHRDGDAMYFMQGSADFKVYLTREELPTR